MECVYKKALKEYFDSNDVGGCYANQVIAELKNKGVYPLAEELSQIESFLPKDKIGAKPLSDESLQDIIDSGKDFFDIDELPLKFLNYEAKIFKSPKFSSE